MLRKKYALNMSFHGHNCLSFKPSKLIVRGPGVQISHGFYLSFLYLHFYTAAIIYANEKSAPILALQEFVFYHPLALYEKLMYTFHWQRTCLWSHGPKSVYDALCDWIMMTVHFSRILRQWGSRWTGNKFWSKRLLVICGPGDVNIAKYQFLI